MNLDELKSRHPLTVPVNEAALIMGVSAQFLRMALLQEKFSFGVGVKMGQNEFYINTERFLLYMKGSDLGGKKPA